MRLALAMQRVDVEQMLASMTSRQLTRWMAFFELDPWGEGRADLRMGIQTANLLEVHRDKKSKPESFTPMDFMPYVKRPKVSAAALLRAGFAHMVKQKKRR